MLKTRIKLSVWRHHSRLQRGAWQSSKAYQKYLETQLIRTLSKKNVPLPEHSTLLINRIAKLIDLTKCDVLCIGPRNRAEIDYLYHKGAKSVVGIDLYSEDKAILVMDMHQMTFPENYFDLIYSAHSLEHAYNVQKESS